MKTVTLEKLREFDSVYEAISWAISQKGKYPNKIIKPVLPLKFDSTIAKQYAIDLEKWEKDNEQYLNNVVEWKKNSSLIDSIIIEYIKAHAGIEIVPEKYRDKLYNYAYREGHSSGYYEVYLKLEELIDIFE